MPRPPSPRAARWCLPRARTTRRTLNFLPETHVVVLAAGDVVGDFEAAFAKLRARYGKGVLPRTVNMITGPSRSGDIQQTLILGAHGPRRLHIVLVG